jgi:hypothetical protein
MAGGAIRTEIPTLNCASTFEVVAAKERRKNKMIVFFIILCLSDEQISSYHAINARLPPRMRRGQNSLPTIC